MNKRQENAAVMDIVSELHINCNIFAKRENKFNGDVYLFVETADSKGYVVTMHKPIDMRKNYKISWIEEGTLSKFLNY